MTDRPPAGNRSVIGLGSLSHCGYLPPAAWLALRTTLRKNSIRPVTNSSVKSRAASMTFLRCDSSGTSLDDGWSVIVLGIADVLSTSGEINEADRAGLRPWVATLKTPTCAPYSFSTSSNRGSTPGSPATTRYRHQLGPLRRTLRLQHRSTHRRPQRHARPTHAYLARSNRAQ
jgi:hypothetical protein